MERHLKGDETILLYSTSPENTCKWACWDLDYDDDEFLAIIATECRNWGLNPIFQGKRTGRSGHLWLFFDIPLSARALYAFGQHWKGDVGVPLEYFPKQPELKEGGLGNGVRIPLGLHRKVLPAEDWGLFPDCPYNPAREIRHNLAYQAQWLLAQPRSSSERIRELLMGGGFYINDRGKKRTPNSQKPGDLLAILPEDWPRKSGGSGEVKTRCPVCAEEGHDDSEANLYINEGDNVLYCHYNSGQHTFMQILDAFRRLKLVPVQ